MRFRLLFTTIYKRDALGVHPWGETGKWKLVESSVGCAIEERTLPGPGTIGTSTDNEH